MPLPPTLPLKRAVTGSNLPRNRLASVRRKQLAADYAALDAVDVVAGERKPSIRLTRTERKRLLALKAAARAAWSASGSIDASALRHDAHARFSRRLVRAVPLVKAIKTSQRRYLAARAAALTALINARPQLGNPVDPAEPSVTKIFRSPFSLAHTWVDSDGDELELKHRSFVLPASGQLVLDADFDHNDSGWPGMHQLFGVPAHHIVRLSVACGVGYTLPRSGRIRISAEFANLYNQVVLSVRDNFGLSAGSLWCDVSLFARIMLPNRETVLTRSLATQHLSSDGEDRSIPLPDLDQATPHLLERTTDGSFAEGEPVWIMAGCSIDVDSAMDDMHGHVRALLWWQLRRLSVSVVG